MTNPCLHFRYSDPDYLLSLEDAIQNGLPTLLENVTEEMDPGLEPVLLRQTFRQKGTGCYCCDGGVSLSKLAVAHFTDCILIGDSVIEYNPDFRLYLVTELRNPHFAPEVAVKVTLLNFTITPEGLQDQVSYFLPCFQSIARICTFLEFSAARHPGCGGKAAVGRDEE